MENRNIIVVLVVIIVILAAAIGFMVLKPMYAKEPTKLKITSNDTLYEGNELTFKLIDLNKTPLSNQKVNITIKNSKGEVVANKTVETNDEGNAKMDLELNKGKYKVDVIYGGNDNFTGCNVTKKIQIENTVEEANIDQNEYVGDGGSSSSGNRNYRPAVDSGGVTREIADKYGYEYTTDHGGHYIGKNDHWDEKAGVYHD